MSKVIKSREDLKNLYCRILEGRKRIKYSVTICGGTGCRAQGSENLRDAFEREIKKRAWGRIGKIKMSGCHGFCEMGPIVLINPGDIFYIKVKAEDISEIIEKTIIKGQYIERLCYKGNDGEIYTRDADIPFYKYQKRFILKLNGRIDPTSIEDYIISGGYSALVRVLYEMSPDEVINEIANSQLRGRGGGGFSTARKWKSCKDAPGDIHYVICNGDEGDPGAFMDRSIMEGNPHSVLEGMIIGAYAIGSSQGYIYVRAEYPLAVEHLQKAIDDAYSYGLLGNENMLGKGCGFDIKIIRGGGAFVCGESTALMASLQGEVGEPRAKFIHTVERGLWEKPTNLNNVETWANIPLIINSGSKKFASIGTENSKGTKVFSLVGKINNTGLVEVPMGITLREIIDKIGGGIPNNKRFKAVQTGGPSGGCIPEQYLDLPVDFDNLSRIGSMMGSGGMIVMDEDTCMVDIARYFMDFLKDESCGKCTSCREGIKQMSSILEKICAGYGEEGDIEKLEEIAKLTIEVSLCALGTSAPNPVLTTIKYFRGEYNVHIKEKKCPAHVCSNLIKYKIVREVCVGCGVCAKACPVKAVKGKKKLPHSIDEDKCIKCSLCKVSCKFDAINIE
ncbi:MAG TPA: NADH-quinone oxidoreductase subunit NuoF [Desulfatiglandales bacterium]|nr:NADH-quinone oxidoreductase subunit NuoF [Desulfatiglandales bacterium]